MRKNWNTVPISELYEGLYDGPHATPKSSDVGPIFLGIKNVTDDGHLDLSDIRHIAEEDYVTWTRRVEPKPGDIVFTYEATLNRYAIIPQGFRGCLGRRMALIRTEPGKVDTRFLFYYFFAPAWREVIKKNMLAGATVDRIPLIAFPSFPVSVPPLPIQRRIAGILSAYDELIENSQRRIRILETMARALYREWFVHFRFPGHETHPRVPSPLGDIPQGWDVKKLGEIAENFDRLRKPLSKMERAEMQGDYPYYGAAKVFDHVNNFIFEGEYLLMAEDGSVITTERAPVLQLVNEKFWPNNHTHVLRGKSPFSTHFLYLGLSEVDISPYITGAAQPKITQENMNRIPFFCGPQQLHEGFNRLVAPMIQQSQILQRQIQNLRRTRDLLLPRLLSGQVNLEEN